MITSARWAFLVWKPCAEAVGYGQSIAPQSRFGVVDIRFGV
jgi:hypothetical protein